MSVNNPNHSIFILVDTLFYPARRNGMSVRYFPLVRGLAERGYTVDALIINRFQEQYSPADIQGLRQHCRYVEVINPATSREGLLRRLLRRIRNVAHLLAPFGRPYELIDNQRDHYFAQVEAWLVSRDRYAVGIGVGVGGNNADLLLSLPEAIQPHRIFCDFIDSAYLLRKRARNGYLGLLNPIAWLENVKTRRWERSLCDRCECIYISENDARSAGTGKTYIIPNGIVADGFDASSTVALESPNIAFLGNMAYMPNIDACNYLIEEIFPQLRKRLPGIHLYIIGRNPGKNLLEQCRDSSIHVTGEVDNIWDYIRSVNVFVFPIISGAGLQNKVLEAMFAGKPVVTSSIANEGIGAEHGKEIYIAEHVDDYVSCIEKAINSPEQTSKQAREFITGNFSENGILDRYIKLLGKEFQASHTPFDLTKYESPYEINRLKILKDLIPLGHGKSTIDIGCGPGYFSRELSTKGWKTSSVDTNSENIESTKNYAHETHLGDALNVLPELPENQYDLALSLEIIEHMPKAQGRKLLQEIMRVLKPRGRLIISTPNRFSPEGLGGYYWGEKIRGWEKWDACDSTHVHIYSSPEILQLVKSSGFSVNKIIGYHYEGTLPLIGRWKLPLVKSTMFPLNRIGFNIILDCHKK